MSSNTKFAAEYMNPFGQPQPSDETGPGSSLVPQNTKDTVSNNGPYTSIEENLTGASASSTSTNPFRRGPRKPTPIANDHTRNVSGSSNGSNTLPPSRNVSSHSRVVSGGSNTPSPRRERIPSAHLEAFPDSGHHTRRSGDFQRSSEPAMAGATRSRRVSSLKERYPGDPSVRPLDTLKHEAKAAHRSPHLKKHHIPGADTIDQLDNVLGRYHHEGPYDAALLARNTSYINSPVAALKDSNEEALKATPQEKIKDAVDSHKPLDGVATVPPGSRDQFDRVYKYEEGTNMMLAGAEGGDYKRWPGVDYHPDDIKGKGEPSYSIERALKEHKTNLREEDTVDGNFIELVERPRHGSVAELSGHQIGHRRYGSVEQVGVSKGPGAAISGAAEPSGSAVASGSNSAARPTESYKDWEGGVRRSGSAGGKLSGEFKRRIGSLRRKGKDVE